MKKQYYILAFISLLLISCGKDNKLFVGNSISKKISIDFDSISQQNNDWHQFDFEKTDGLIVNFSKGSVSDGKYIITAQQYLKDKKPIEVILKAKKVGAYSFKLTYVQSSKSAEVDFKNGQSIEFPKLIVEAKWKAYIPYFIAIFIILLIVVIWLIIKTKKNNSFDTGFLQVTRPKNEQIDLEGKAKINLAKMLEIKDIVCLLYCEKDSKFEEEEEIEIKRPLIEVDSDMKIIINEIDNGMTSVYLTHQDKVVVLDNNNTELIKFQYNQF